MLCLVRIEPTNDVLVHDCAREVVKLGCFQSENKFDLRNDELRDNYVTHQYISPEIRDQTNKLVLC